MGGCSTKALLIVTAHLYYENASHACLKMVERGPHHFEFQLDQRPLTTPKDSTRGRAPPYGVSELHDQTLRCWPGLFPAMALRDHLQPTACSSSTPPTPFHLSAVVLALPTHCPAALMSCCLHQPTPPASGALLDWPPCITHTQAVAMITCPQPEKALTQN